MKIISTYRPIKTCYLWPLNLVSGFNPNASLGFQTSLLKINHLLCFFFFFFFEACFICIAVFALPCYRNQMVSICRHEIWRGHLGCWSASLPSPRSFLKALRGALNTRGRSDVDTNGERREKAKWSTSSCFPPHELWLGKKSKGRTPKSNSWKKGRSKVCSLSPVTLPVLGCLSSRHTYLP